MEYDELLNLLDIDSAAELVYFEQFAELMEHGNDIPYDTLVSLVEGMDSEALPELVEGYFEDVMKFVPDGESDLYTLLQNIATTLSTLSAAGEEDSAHVFAEELYKFRSWYLFDSTVLIKDLADDSEREIPLMEALTSYRAQNFTDEDYHFDFSDALDYSLDEYIVSLGSLSDYGDDDDYDDSYDDEDDMGEDD